MLSSTSFSGDNGFVLIHAIFSYIFLVLTIILNITVFILVKSSTKINEFRGIVYASSFANIIFAVAFSICLPQWAKASELIIFFPTGPFAHSSHTTAHVWMVLRIVYFYVACLVSAAFVHRYFAVVKIGAHYFVSRFVTTINFLPVPLWIIDSFLQSDPSLQLRRKVKQEFGNKYAVNFEKIHLIAFDCGTTEIYWLRVIGIILSFVQLCAMIWTGMRIYQSIQKSTTSPHSKLREKQAFRLLLSQAINPLIFLHGPAVLNAIQAATIAFPDVVNQTTSLMAHFFTVTNPLLNIFLSRELSKSLTILVFRRPNTRVSIVKL